MRILTIKITIIGLLFILFGFQSQALAVNSCGGFYSPSNPFPCSNGGNCVWWTWHWLRHGKGHRNLSDTTKNKFKRSALYWDDDAISMGMTVDGNLEKGAIAVNETQSLSDGTVTGHVAVLVDWDSAYLYVDEMNWGSYGLTQRKKYRRSNNYFRKFIHPFPQPKLLSILPSPIYKADYNQNFILNGENLDTVMKLELTFPNNGTGTLSGSQLPWKNYSQLSFLATFGTSGRYIINAVTDKNVESIPRMPFDVY